MASDNSEVLAAIAGLKEHLSSTDAKVAIILAQTSALQSLIADLNASINQAIDDNQNTGDSVAVNEIIAVSEQASNIQTIANQILTIVQNIPTQTESQGLA